MKTFAVSEIFVQPLWLTITEYSPVFDTEIEVLFPPFDHVYIVGAGTVGVDKLMTPPPPLQREKSPVLEAIVGLEKLLYSFTFPT